MESGSGSDDVHDPRRIIGKNREGHLGGYLWERFGQEVRRPHAGFHRAERMFDRLSTHRGAAARLRADAPAPTV
jgi:hypothetical protein